MISIIVPTVDGREDHYERCVSAYENRTEDEFEIITIRNRATCGLAWQEGAEQAQGLYIHFTADDLEPALAWDIGAREIADAGKLPAPTIFTRDTGIEERIGVQPDGFFTRIPFCTREQWEKIGPMIPIHYYTDNYFSWRGILAGYPTVLAPGYAFKHHWADPARGAGMTQNERLIFDANEYLHYQENGYELVESKGKFRG